MSRTDGSEGPIGKDAYLAIYSVDELIDCNDSLGTQESLLIFFATDRGGEGYAYDLQQSKSPIIAIEFDTLDRSYAKDMGSTFLEFLEIVSKA